MDPFSIALGVLQITGTAIKLSLLLQKKIKVFRNYSREVSRILKVVDRQQKNFVHEIHLLLRLAKQDEDDIERMLQDADDSQWSSLVLQAGLDAAFPKSLDTVEDVIEEIGSELQAVQGELSCFDEIMSIGAKNEPLKDMVHRVGKKAKLSWKKENIEEQIKSLRDLNNDLRHLREQAAEIKEPIVRSTALSRPAHQLSHEYGSIGKVRRASKAFHQALAAAWLNEISNTKPEEVRHNVKLKLDTQVGDAVKMEVVIACYGHSRLRPTSIQAGLVNLHVESRILDFMESGLNTPPNSGDDGRRKKRKVRFNFDVNQEESTTASSSTTTQDLGPIDLRASQNICTALQGTSVHPCDPKCLGYLDSCCNEVFRHSFFGMATPSQLSESICVSAKEILSRPAETSVRFVDQLTLARSFAMAVLKFHSTPWLGDYVTIQDFSFFSSDDSDLSRCIQTAHLGFDFVHSSPRDNFPIPTEDMIDKEAIEDAKLAHGIRNLTLWGLGTVMLQIGTWSTLESPDDVVAVRRLARKARMLGKEYRDLTQRCLDCDFAFGDDLSKPRLQQAVYEHVVCGLTELIKRHDIQED